MVQIQRTCWLSFQSLYSIVKFSYSHIELALRNIPGLKMSARGQCHYHSRSDCTENLIHYMKKNLQGVEYVNAMGIITSMFDIWGTAQWVSLIAELSVYTAIKSLWTICSFLFHILRAPWHLQICAQIGVAMWGGCIVAPLSYSCW